MLRNVKGTLLYRRFETPTTAPVHCPVRESPTGTPNEEVTNMERLLYNRGHAVRRVEETVLRTQTHHHTLRSAWFSFQDLQNDRLP
ncbi:hypothetical protein ANN_12548 [Periplaneta americana]|uniref:Uncharacterized protein n=1 Tax=Periplaneta americana TaxID=6978 RepID=A0ABQ8TJ12_PERAM|nr:hypothetical protein ANN_12548 [Periplaneta americana]